MALYSVAVSCSPRETVDNARLSTKVAVDEVDNVLVHFLWFLGDHRILQVGTVEALCEPEGDRERERVCGRGEWERKEEEGGKEEGERESHREGNVVGRKGGLGCDQDIECS